MAAAAKSPLVRLATLPFRVAHRLWRLATDPRYRHVQRLNAHPSKESFQPFNTTKADRYPRIFGFVQRALGADSPLNILSFGCSTGEEVFSLRRYFPRAAIKGVDINPGNIAVCRKRLARAGDASISFGVAASTAGEPVAAYDAIFCMAVLRHGGWARPALPVAITCCALPPSPRPSRISSASEAGRAAGHPPQQFPPVRTPAAADLTWC